MEQRIAIYMRLSLEDVDKRTNAAKDESNSIASQRLLIHHHLESCTQLCDLPRVEFCDDGFTGTNFDRPEFLRMIEMVKRGKISCIAVKDLSRFGRDYLEVGDYLEHIFPFLGVRFVSVNDRYDSENHKGQSLGMDVTIRNLIYDYYSKDLSKKVKSAMSMLQKTCSLVNCAPYGYRVSEKDKHRLVVDPKAAMVVRRIYGEIAAGKTCTEVAKELNDEGVLTPAQYKGIKRRDASHTPQWTHRIVLLLIKNIKYTGTMVNHTRENRHIRDKNQRKVPQSEWYVKEDAHEAIVSREEYEAALSAIRYRRPTVIKAHDCSDRVYFCAYCGAKLEKINGTAFACPSHRYHEDSPCVQVRMSKADLEGILLDALRRQLSIVEMKQKKQTKDALPVTRLYRQVEVLNAQIEECRREKLSIYEAYSEGRLELQAYKEGRGEWTARQTELEEAKSRCEQEIERLAQRESEQTLGEIALPKRLTDGQLRAHLYDAVERVVVYSQEEIEIVWKFDAPKTMTADQTLA